MSIVKLLNVTAATMMVIIITVVTVVRVAMTVQMNMLPTTHCSSWLHRISRFSY